MTTKCSADEGESSMTQMTDEQIVAALKAADAIRTGHFVLTSGRHSDTYVQCARILEDPHYGTRQDSR